MVGQPATITAVALTSAAFTIVATSPWSVKIVCTSGNARLALGTSVPAVDSDNWYPLPAYKEFEMSGMAGANVYARSEGATATLKVVAA